MIEFILYFLTFMLTESDINNRAAQLLGAQMVNPVYAGGLLCTAGGFLIYGILCKVLKRQILAKWSVLCAVMLDLLSIVWKLPMAFILVSYLCLISLGMVGGYLHEEIGIAEPSSRLGTYLGYGMALAIMIQFVFQNFTSSYLVTTVLLFLLAILVLVSLFKNKDNQTIDVIEKSFPIKDIRWESMIVMLISGILALQDSIVVLKNANGEIALFSYVRIFYALGLLLAGLLADYQKGRYFNLSVICSAFISTIAIAAFRGGNTYYNLSMMVMYFYSGFYVMFLTYTFICKGRGYANSGLISGLGRVIRSVVTAIVVLVMIPFTGHESLGIISTLSCLFAIVILVIAYLGNLLLSPVQADYPLNLTTAFEEEHFVDFFTKYHLTDREQEVFRLFVTTEQENQFIAENLGLSRRVLQRHIAAIYEKTDTHTRIGLLQKFINR